MIIFIIHPEETASKTWYRTGYFKMEAFPALVISKRLGDVDFYSFGNNKRPHFNSHGTVLIEVVEIKSRHSHIGKLMPFSRYLTQMLMYQDTVVLMIT